MTLNKTSAPGTVLVLASLIFILSTGCGEKKQVRGREFVPRDDMVKMMVDIHLLDGITNDVKYYRKYNPNDSIDLYGKIFEKHGYERARFDTTLAEYAMNPYLLDALYADVMMELNLLEEQINKEEQEKAREKAKDNIH